MPKKGERDPFKERYWRKALADWEASGLSAKRFCDENDVHYTGFMNWKKRLAQRDAEMVREVDVSETVDFTPVRVVGNESLHESSMVEKHATALEVVLPNGIVLRLASACPMKLVSDVVSLLGVN